MQKKTGLLIPLFLIFFQTANAQFKKGQMMAGASVGSVLFNSGTSDITVAQIGSSTSKITSYNINISPILGWFVSENTAIGAAININPSSNKTTYEEAGSTFQKDKNSGFNIGLGGFVRHYFSESVSMKPFGQISLNAGMSNLNTDGFFYYKSSSPYYKYTYSGKSSGGFFANFTFSGGLTKMIGEYTGLDFYLGYAYSYSKNVFKQTTNYFLTNTPSPSSTGSKETTSKFTNHGFLIGVGFQIFLKGKK